MANLTPLISWFQSHNGSIDLSSIALTTFPHTEGGRGGRALKDIPVRSPSHFPIHACLPANAQWILGRSHSVLDPACPEPVHTHLLPALAVRTRAVERERDG